MTEACIVGWAHTPFGKLEDPDVESLIGRVARAAIEDAGIAPGEIDAVFVGQFNNGFSKQDFPSSLVLQSLPELRFTRATRYENACASGSAAVHGARDFLAAGHTPAQAAVEAGFADQSHMTRAFARQFGVTPGRYRTAVA